jgi:hypothetical protein
VPVLPSDADIVVVARAIRLTYGSRAVALMEGRSKGYEQAGAWGTAEFWGEVARVVREIELAEGDQQGH